MTTIDATTVRPCEYCGEPRTIEADERLCTECLDAAEMENAHEDGDHDGYGYGETSCRSCRNGEPSAATRARMNEPSAEERAAARGDWLRQVRKEEGDR